MLKSNFEFQVLVNGSPAKEYYHQGSHYMEGKENSKFSIRLKNNSGSRVLFVPTVDGLSVMSGDKASFESRGYIVSAYDSITVEGWRTSDKNVAEFFFTHPKGSYAKKTKKGDNLGVIGGAVFKEKVKPRSNPTWEVTYATATPPKYPDINQYPAVYFTTSGLNVSGGGSVGSSLALSSANAASNMMEVKASLGAGFGQDKYSPTIGVDFDKETSPEAVFSIFYNTRQKLEEIGVEFKKPVYITPSAFPNEEGYCKRPN